MGKRRIPRYRQVPNDNAVPPTSGGISAVLSRQAANNSYSPPSFYDDQPFVCIDCGKEEIWTAKQQQWWFEVVKGSIYSRAIRCRACRKKRRAERSDKSSAANQPIRHVGTLMKLLRAAVDPAILAAGFDFDGRNRPPEPFGRFWIDYKRDDSLLSLAFERRDGTPRLIAELLDEGDGCRIVAVHEFNPPRTKADIMATVDAFAAAITEFAAHLERRIF